MTWQFLDRESYDWMLSAGAVPGDIHTVLGDTGWATMFQRWSDEHGPRSGDVDLDSVGLMVVAMHDGSSLQELWNRFGSHDSITSLAWETNDAQLGADFENAANGGEPGDVRDRLWAYLVNYAQPYYDAFAADVDERIGVSEPEVAGHIDPRDFDQSIVDGVNEHNLKQTDEGGVISFFQARELVLIGDGFPTEYVRFAANAGRGGTITVRSRGSFGSTGEILVEGAADEDLFKAAVRRFSKKKITFA